MSIFRKARDPRQEFLDAQGKTFAEKVDEEIVEDEWVYDVTRRAYYNKTTGVWSEEIIQAYKGQIIPIEVIK